LYRIPIGKLILRKEFKPSGSERMKENEKFVSFPTIIGDFITETEVKFPADIYGVAIKL
jgi:hypothetical protein